MVVFGTKRSRNSRPTIDKENKTQYMQRERGCIMARQDVQKEYDKAVNAVLDKLEALTKACGRFWLGT
jgi:hypothetical protein